MYSNDPSYHTYQPVKRVRLWPWVLLVGLIGITVYAWIYEPVCKDGFHPWYWYRTIDADGNQERVTYCERWTADGEKERYHVQ